MFPGKSLPDSVLRVLHYAALKKSFIRSGNPK